jgi:hypothetical protein
MVYEEIIQKFESDIRMHLRHQNFLKLHIDTLQHTLELNNKEIKTLKETFETTKEIKDKMERVHHKELADVKAQEIQLSQKVIGLKDKITELSMYITTNNAPTTHTLDKRDPLYITLSNQTMSQFPKNKIAMSKNDSYKGNGYIILLL